MRMETPEIHLYPEVTHTDLICDVVPGAGSSLSLQGVTQQLAHLKDALSHAVQLLLPGLVQGRVREHLVHEQSTVAGGRGVPVSVFFKPIYKTCDDI